MDDLDRLDCMSATARRILRGLQTGQWYYVSASEAEEVEMLRNKEFVQVRFVAGFPGCALTDRGREAITQYNKRADHG